MIFDGRKAAEAVYAGVRRQVAGLGRTPTVLAITVAPNAATQSYLKIKSARAKDAGMELIVERFPETVTEEELVSRVNGAAEDAIIVQLPLPPHLDQKRVLDAIPLLKDADALSSAAREAFAEGGAAACIPPVAAAVAYILSTSGIDSRGLRAVVVGDGWLVGKPVAAWLMRKGLQVTVLTRESGDLAEALHDADVIVSGAGVPRLIKPGMAKPGAILIDAGTSESGGEVVGDIDPACAQTARIYTPVPGGVGPLAVACLYANAALLVASDPPGVY